MKRLYFTLTFILFFILAIPNIHAQTNESKLVFKAVYKGGYSNFADTTDKKWYFLIEGKLINKTDSVCEFVTMSCASLISIVKDSKQIEFLYHNCAGNYPIRIRLKPNQEFSIPFIIYRKESKEEFKQEVKFGFVLVNPKLFAENPRESLIEMNKKQENVIWSEPIEIGCCSYFPFNITHEINDSTFIDVDYFGFKKMQKK